jgi:DNA-directed RNA polymerase subunit RPC12/RpoP
MFHWRNFAGNLIRGRVWKIYVCDRCGKRVETSDDPLVLIGRPVGVLKEKGIGLVCRECAREAQDLEYKFASEFSDWYTEKGAKEQVLGRVFRG